tara:strand:- start:2197 stop:2439 length:243 start_codon:yes stop_codon:yes gene_type:complete
MDNFIGSIIFEYWGAFLVYLFQKILYPLVGKKSLTFKEIYNGDKKSNHSEIILSGFIHITVGIVSVILILLLAIRVYKYS